VGARVRWLLGAMLGLAATVATPFGASPAADPTAVVTSHTAVLSPQAQLGRQIFFDPALSASGKLSCASCHDPANAYAAPKTSGVVMTGGASMDRPGLRAVPSLRYLSDTPRFARHSYIDVGRDREDVGPAGGLMLDGRADNLREQMLLPLLDSAEMGNANVEEVAIRLERAPYAGELRKIASAAAYSSVALGSVAPGSAAPNTPLLVATDPNARTPVATASDARSLLTAAPDARPLVAAAAAALERFELEDLTFHPYTSRFDDYLRGTGTLSPDELEGLRLFVDSAKGNCAACHTAITGPGGSPPNFTDHSYHALGVPRNPAIPANTNPRFFDLGMCGPRRADLRAETRYCGYFKTPTLRNVTRRRFFFHNGRFTTLQDVMRFYVERDTNPESWYPTIAGRLRKFDDLPARYRENVNMSDAPLNRGPGDTPALDNLEIKKVIAFLGTLSDVN
jgi:cytochrome c peroxidase